jgi:hypothetical protein
MAPAKVGRAALPGRAAHFVSRMLALLIFVLMK